MRKLLILPVCLLLAACATITQPNMDWIPTGPTFPKTMPPDVKMVPEKREIPRPSGNLGFLRIKNLERDRDPLKRGVEKARRFVASKGADAMFLGQYNSAEDGAPNPKVTLIVYALKYVDDLSEADIKAMEEFEVEGALNASLDF